MIIRLVFAALLLLLLIIDIRQRQIWHAVTIPGIIGALVFGRFLPARHWINGLLGIGICGGLFLVIWAVANWRYQQAALGFGDVMLAALLGALGGIYSGLLALAIGMFLAGGDAAIRLLRHASRTSTLPYGAWLSVAGIVVLLVS